MSRRFMRASAGGKRPDNRSVTLADIRIAYIAVFGGEFPSDLPFATAGEQVRKAYPKTWHDIIDAAEAARCDLPLGSYKEQAMLARGRLQEKFPLPFARIPHLFDAV